MNLPLLSRRPRFALPGRYAALLALPVLALSVSTPLHAVNKSWDPDLDGTNGANGGTGTWDLNATANWLRDGGTADETWTDSTGTVDTATFGGTAGTVTLGSNLGALGLIFNTTGYTVAPGTGPFTLSLGASGINAGALTSGTTTISAGVAMVASSAWNVGTGATLLQSGLVSGAFNLGKSGAGTLSLTNNGNNYSGGTTLSGGRLTLASNTNFGTGGIGTGGIVFQGGTLGQAFIAANTLVYENAMSVAAGQVGTIETSNRFRMNGAVSGAGTLNLAIISTVSRADLQNSFTGFTGNLNFTGTGGIVRLGVTALATGQPLFAAAGFANTTLSVDGVTLQPVLGNTSATLTIGALASTGTTGVLGEAATTTGAAGNGAVTYSVGGKNVAATYGGRILGDSLLTKTGTETQTLSSTLSNFTGAVNVNGGTLALAGGDPGGTGATTAVGNTTVARNLNVNNGGTLRFDAGDVLAGNTVTPAATLVIAAGGTVTNNGASFNTLGPVNLNGGTLTGTGGSGNGQFQMYQLRGTVTAGGTVASTISGAGTTGGGSGASTVGYHLNGPITFDVADVTASAAPDLLAPAAFIDGVGATPVAGGITKTGAGTMVLSGANTYTGATTVAAGQLVVSGMLNATSPVTVTGPTSTLAGAGTVGAVTIAASGGILAPGNLDATGANTLGTLTTGAVDLSAGGAASQLTLQLGATTGGIGAADLLNVGGTLNVAGANLVTLTLAGFAPAQGDLFFLASNDGTDPVAGQFGAFNGTAGTLGEGAGVTIGGQPFALTYAADFSTSSAVGGNDIALLAVPEPSTWAMVAGALGAMTALRRFRRR